MNAALKRFVLLGSVLHAVVAVAPASAQLAPGQPEALPHSRPGTTLHVVTSDGQQAHGALLAVKDMPRWKAKTLAPTDGGVVLRVFGAHDFVVNPTQGTITQVQPGSPAPPTVHDIGPGSEPRDIHVVGDDAWVTRRHAKNLLHIDLVTGKQTESVDLTPLAADGEAISLDTLERDGSRLFVQVGLTTEDPDIPGLFTDRGVLAVVDLDVGALIDTDPLAPGVQGIALDGAPPHLKMQVLERTLYVSTSSTRLDIRGGVERVDLDTLSWSGYALSEEHVSDLGGFVMTSPEGGYFVFHTDIVASTHLKPFTVADGPAPGLEMIVLFESIDSIAHDAARRRIILPGGQGFFGVDAGLYVFSTLTNAPIAGSPVDVGGAAYDAVVVQD